MSNVVSFRVSDADLVKIDAEYRATKIVGPMDSDGVPRGKVTPDNAHAYNMASLVIDRANATSQRLAVLVTYLARQEDDTARKLADAGAVKLGAKSADAFVSERVTFSGGKRNSADTRLAAYFTHIARHTGTHPVTGEPFASDATITQDDLWTLVRADQEARRGKRSNRPAKSNAPTFAPTGDLTL